MGIVGFVSGLLFSFHHHPISFRSDTVILFEFGNLFSRFHFTGCKFGKLPRRSYELFYRKICPESFPEEKDSKSRAVRTKIWRLFCLALVVTNYWRSYYDNTWNLWNKKNPNVHLYDIGKIPSLLSTGDSISLLLIFFGLKYFGFLQPFMRLLGISNFLVQLTQRVRIIKVFFQFYRSLCPTDSFFQ